MKIFFCSECAGPVSKAELDKGLGVKQDSNTVFCMKCADALGISENSGNSSFPDDTGQSKKNEKETEQEKDQSVRKEDEKEKEEEKEEKEKEEEEEDKQKEENESQGPEQKSSVENGKTDESEGEEAKEDKQQKDASKSRESKEKAEKKEQKPSKRSQRPAASSRRRVSSRSSRRRQQVDTDEQDEDEEFSKWTTSYQLKVGMFAASAVFILIGTVLLFVKSCSPPKVEVHHIQSKLSKSLEEARSIKSEGKRLMDSGKYSQALDKFYEASEKYEFVTKKAEAKGLSEQDKKEGLSFDYIKNEHSQLYRLIQTAREMKVRKESRESGRYKD